MFCKMILAELKTYLLQWLLKPALVNIATTVEKMMLPIDPNFEKEKSSQDNHESSSHNNS